MSSPAATSHVAELAEVDGVNDALATQIRERLTRVTETSILDQYSWSEPRSKRDGRRAAH